MKRRCWTVAWNFNFQSVKNRCHDNSMQSAQWNSTPLENSHAFEQSQHTYPWGNAGEYVCKQLYPSSLYNFYSPEFEFTVLGSPKIVHIGLPAPEYLAQRLLEFTVSPSMTATTISSLYAWRRMAAGACTGTPSRMLSRKNSIAVDFSRAFTTATSWRRDATLVDARIGRQA